MTRQKLWHIILVVGGSLAVLAPDMAQAAAVLSGIESPWLKWPIRVLGMLALIGSRWDKIRAKLAPVLGKPSSNTPMVALLAMGSLLLISTSCHNTKPDEFFKATVDCAKVNPEGSAALAGVTTCLVSVATGNPAGCLVQLVTVSRFTVTEVACVVAWVAERENQKVAISAAGPSSLEVRNRAINWLVQEQISIRNTYAGAP